MTIDINTICPVCQEVHDLFCCCCGLIPDVRGKGIDCSCGIQMPYRARETKQRLVSRWNAARYENGCKLIIAGGAFIAEAIVESGLVDLTVAELSRHIANYVDRRDRQDQKQTIKH